MVDFGDTELGVRASRTVSVENTGTRPIDIVVEGVDGLPSDFQFSPSTLRISVGETVDLQVEFVPSAGGEQVGTLRLRASQEGVAEATIALRGNGLEASSAIELSTTTVMFGGVVVQTEGTQTLTLTNVSSSSIRIDVDLANNLGICGEPSAQVSDFCLDPRGRLDVNDRFVIEADEALTVGLGYNPVVAGPSSGQLRLRPCENCNDIVVSLEGFGVESGIACSESVDFGRVLPGDCRTEQVACENVGNLGVTVTAFGARPGRPLPIEFRPQRLDEPVALAPNETAMFDVEFCPDDTSETTSAVRIDATDAQDNDSVNITDLVGQGGGPRAELSVSRIDFGQTALIAPNRRRLILRNTGFDDLIVRNIDPDIAATGAFSTMTSVATIPADGELSIEIEFQPLTLGPVTSGVQLEFEEIEAVTVPLAGVGVNPPPCNYTVDTDVDFGVVSAEQVRSASTLIRNVGQSDCLIYRIAAEPQTPGAFELVGTASVTEVLPAGGSREIEVRLAGAAGPSTLLGEIEIQVSSPTAPLSTVVMAATILDAGPVFGPSVVDFGVLEPGCTTSTQTVRISNPTPAQIIVSAAQVVGSSEFVVNRFPGLGTIGNDGNFSFDVTFDPSGVGVFAGFVDVSGTINGQAARFRVPLRAVVQDPAGRRETFRQGSASLDVLGVFNQTFRANTFIGAARTNWGGFAAELLANSVDFRVGVTTTDIMTEGGQFLPNDAMLASRVLVPSTPNLDSEWGQRFRGTGGFGGTAVAGFEAARQALSFARLSASNSGFRRPSGPLSVVIVNPDADTSAGSVQAYLDNFASGFFPGQQNDLMISGLLVTGNTNCSGTFGFGFPNPRLQQVVEATGGRLIDWCGMDRAAIFAELAQATAGLRTRWRLAQPVQPSSIVVRVNGTEVLPSDMGVTQWNYDASSQNLTFTDVALPRFGDRIDVDYRPSCGQ